MNSTNKVTYEMDFVTSVERNNYGFTMLISCIEKLGVTITNLGQVPQSSSFCRPAEALTYAGSADLRIRLCLPSPLLPTIRGRPGLTADRMICWKKG